MASQKAVLHTVEKLVFAIRGARKSRRNRGILVETMGL